MRHSFFNGKGMREAADNSVDKPYRLLFYIMWQFRTEIPIQILLQALFSIYCWYERGAYETAQCENMESGSE